jgi:hypothetical protein
MPPGECQGGVGPLAYTTPTRDWDLGPVNSPLSRGGYGPNVKIFTLVLSPFWGLVDENCQSRVISGPNYAHLARKC